jgi:pyridoxine 5'-phosphate synthase PdxJ
MDDNLEVILRELAISLYTELTPEDKPIIGESIHEIATSHPMILIRNIRELYEALTQCKKTIEKVDFFDEFAENQGYQKALQKLDNEIRNHIKTELQMKVFLDSLEEQISTAKQEKTNVIESNVSVLEKIKDDNKHLKAKLALKNVELDELKRSTADFDESALETLKKKTLKNCEKIEELEKSNNALKQRWLTAKSELECRQKEYERHKTEFLALKKSISMIDDTKYGYHNRSERFLKETKDNSESKSSRGVKTPTKADRSVSPLPLTYQQKGIQYTKTAQSTKKLEKSPLAKILKSDLSRYKSKIRLPIYVNQKK